ncbi:MAG: biopolymer transporter ExbD [Proteobacteria bacterium]|nr:biopolymer transporter ExbD [Pseudomonadota bacterium]
MAGPLGSRGRFMADINVTPFVDVVLVLLVVLMVTAVQIVRASIVVELPKAASAGSAVASTLNIVIEADGQLLIDGRQVDGRTLADEVRRLKAADPKLQAVIAADKRVAYQHVMSAIDVVKSNGVASFALDIQRKAKGPTVQQP